MTNDIKDWSTTPASNDASDPGINWQEGMPPSAVNNSARGMMAAIKTWWGESLGGISAHATDIGIANAYIIAPTPAITTYVTGQTFHFFAANENTGASTLNVNGLGAKTIQRNGAAMVSGDIGAGDLVSVVYDGTGFQLPVIPSNLSLSELSVDTDTLFVDAATGRIGIGTTAPGRLFSLVGLDSSVPSGPHQRYLTVADTKPLLEIVPYTHDNISIGFDAYLDDVGGWKSSDIGSNFQILKNADAISLKYDSGVAAGAAVTWNTGLSMDVSGNIDISTGNLELAGNTTLPINQLATLGASDFDQTADSLLMWDSSTSSHKQVKLQDFGLTVVSETAAKTFTAGDANSFQVSFSVGAVTWTVPPGSSEAFEVGTAIQIFQSGAGQVTVTSDAGVILHSPNGTKISQRYGVACIVKVAADEWVLYGDLTA